MTNLIVEVAKYGMIFLFLFYTFECFAAFRKGKTSEKREWIFLRQRVSMHLIHFLGFMTLYLLTQEIKMIIFYVVQFVFFEIVQNCYGLLYEKSSKLVTNNLCLLLGIGFLMLSRLDFDKAVKQFVIVAVSMVFSFIRQQR